MSGQTFLISVVCAQCFFTTIDFWYEYRQSKKKPAQNPFKFYSILFLVAVILCYTIIQMAGFSLIPKTETLIQWFKDFIPSISLIDLSWIKFNIYTWIILGIFVYYLAGLWDYLVHRFFSHGRRLFFTHEYHHLPNKLFLVLPGLIARPFSFLSNGLFLFLTVSSTIFILKIFNLQDLQLSSLFFFIIFLETIILAITHSEFMTKQWWIYRIFKYAAITSPQEHEMHHTVDLRGNFGDFTSFWDRLFGTYIDPTDPKNQNHALGLSYDQDFLGALTFGKIKFSKKTREKFQIGKYCNIDENKDGAD